MSNLPKQNINKSPWSFYQTQDNVEKLSIRSIKDSTTLYLYNYNTGEEVELDVIPEAVSATYTSRITKQAPFGVMHPINFYTGGTTKSISFSIDLHEDLHGLATEAEASKSIYLLIDRIKSMSEPRDFGGRLREPLVYLQLGNQFAGKGHISTNIKLNTPYRQGRYIYVNMSIDFTYHEDFDIQSVNIEDNIFSFTHSGIAADIFNISEDNYDDFFTQNFDYEYVITQVFADTKLDTYLNTKGSKALYKSTIDAVRAGDLASYLTTAYAAIDQVGVGGADINNVLDVFGVLTILVELTNIIRPLDDVSTTLQNLRILQGKVAVQRNKVISMTLDSSGTYYFSEGRALTISERQLLLEVLLNISDVVANQVAAYSALQGATP